LVRGKATTAGAEIGGGAVPAGRSARKGVCGGAAPVAASVLALTSALGLASGTGAGAVRCGASAGDAGGGGGPLAAGCSTDACCDGSAVVICAGTTSTCRSGTSIRRSCQGKPRPGSHPWPPNIRLSSNVWISSENSSASVSRLRSALALAARASLKPVELKRVLPLQIPSQTI
jgi:hypothetical protein